MEIYNDLKTSASKEFEQLLNSQLSKTKIEEGKIIEGKVNKITEKFVFLFIEGLKSDPILDINELKSMDMLHKVKIGEKILCTHNLLHLVTIKLSIGKPKLISGYLIRLQFYEK